MTASGLVNDYEEERQRLIALLREIDAAVLPVTGSQAARKRWEELWADVQADFFTVVVLGEFKRGKSTLLNALLSQDLLPIGVTPTTAAIHALRWGDPGVTVHYPDGSTTSMPLAEGALQRFVADANPTVVSYLEITLKSPLLQNRVVLVDTPGVDDLNKQRAEITYRFIPRADAVIFLLDATSPVRQTEKLFLEENIYSQGVDRLLFVANFLDQVDPEDRLDLEQAIRNRLAAATGRKVDRLHLVSAQQAFEGRLQQDEERVRESGVAAFEQALQSLLQQGPRSQMKLRRYQIRLVQLLEETGHDMKHLLALKQVSTAELSEQVRDLAAQQERKAQRLEVVNDYVQDRQYEMTLMVRKSLTHFGDRLREAVLSAVDEYKGTDFKAFVEGKVPQTIKRAVRDWAESHADSVETLLATLERELAQGLAKEFQTAWAAVHATRTMMVEDAAELRVEAPDVSRTLVTAGMIAGGVGIVTALIAGPMMPLVGMVAYPYLQRTMLEQRLASAKAQVRPQLEAHLNVILDSFQKQVIGTVQANVMRIEQVVITRFNALMDEFVEQIQREVAVRQIDQQQLSQTVGRLREVDELVRQLLGGEQGRLAFTEEVASA